jgi:hypothetical protein
VTFDEGFFYCQVEPNVLVAKSCGQGDPGQGDGQGGCHAQVTHFRLDTSAMTSVACNGNVPSGTISQTSRSNYEAAQGEMSRDVDNAPLLAWPTKRISSHPRQVFAPTSAEADIIREWASKYSSQ